MMFRMYHILYAISVHYEHLESGKNTLASRGLEEPAHASRGLEELFSSCAVVSVLGSGGK